MNARGRAGGAGEDCGAGPTARAERRGRRTTSGSPPARGATSSDTLEPSVPSRRWLTAAGGIPRVAAPSIARIKSPGRSAPERAAAEPGRSERTRAPPPSASKPNTIPGPASARSSGTAAGGGAG
jgi:hypothetical protein